jgi:hypothetical protein
VGSFARQQRRAAAAVTFHQQRFPHADLRPVPREMWPQRAPEDAPLEVWASRDFVVQIYAYADEGERITVSRTAMQPNGRWAEGITWDDLQRIKRECGRADRWAVEVYPPDDDVVNDASMRHLWLLPKAPPYGWRRGDRRQP